jgi:DNA-binding response OmpR family regulator
MSPLSPTVLVVEDDAALSKAMALALQRAGYRVTTAHDAAHALLTLAGITPCLAVIDMVLPEGSGFQVLRAIKERIKLSVPVVMISGFDSDAHKAYADALGAEAFLVKPFRLDRFLSLATELCPVGP